MKKYFMNLFHLMTLIRRSSWFFLPCSNKLKVPSLYTPSCLDNPYCNNSCHETGRQIMPSLDPLSSHDISRDSCLAVPQLARVKYPQNRLNAIQGWWRYGTQEHLKHWKKKWSHFDLKTWVTNGTKIRTGIPRNLT